MQFSKSKLWLLFALVLIGSSVLFSHLRASPRSPDEQAYLAWALSFALEGKIAEPDGRSVNKNVPPLHTLMVGTAFKSLGIKTEVAQSVSVLGGALSAGVCFLLGCLLLGPRGGVLAAILFVTSGKGEIWEYSNRVLNDIFLVLWTSCILLCAMAYTRWGSQWMALAMGLFLGLGFLTKESVLLTFPVLLGALFLGKKPKSTRLLHFLLVVGVAGSLMAPLIVHRYNAVKLKAAEGAPRYGLRAGNLGTLLDSQKWGFRGLEELGDNVLLRGMPSGVFRVIYGISLLACLVLLWRKKAPKELTLPLLLIFVWIGVFQVFVHLPLTRRQLLPLFPAYDVLASFVIMSAWGFLKSRFFEKRPHPGIVGLAGWAGALSLLLMNMPPQTWAKVNWGEPFRNPELGFLEKEVREALACVPEGALMASNLDRAVYFLLKGKLPVLHLKVSQEQWAGSPSHLRRGKARKRVEVGQKFSGEGFDLVLPKQYAEFQAPIYAIVFSPREPECPIKQQLIGESWEVICKGEGFVVSKWLRRS